MAEIQRDLIVVKALDDIAVQSVGIGAKLHAGQYFGALQCHAPCHDQPDIAGAEYDHPAADHIAFHIDIALRGPGGKDTGGPVARDGDSAAGTLPAAHRQYNGAGFQLGIAFLGIDAADSAVRGNFHYHGIQQDFRFGLPQQRDKAARIFRSGQLLPEAVQPKSVVDALVQDAAQLLIPFDHQYLFGTVIAGGTGGRQPGRAAADHDDVVLLHSPSPPLVGPVSSQLPSSSISTCSLGIPNSRAMIS